MKRALATALLVTSLIFLIAGNSAITPIASTLQLAANKIFMGNMSGVATAITVYGDATLDYPGNLTLASSGVAAGSYARAAVTFDSKGRATVASSGVISATTNFYVATTGSDTTGDGSSGNPWATVGKAIVYLQDYDITATVNIYLADGTYSSSGSTNLLHRHGTFINIAGTHTYVKSISSVQSSSGSSGAYTITFNMNDVANVSVGDYINISGCSGGTNPKYAEGCWPITNVDTGNKRISVSCTNPTGVPAGAVTATSTAVVLKTIIDITSSTTGVQGWTLLTGCLNSIQNCAFTNSGGATSSAGIYIANGSFIKSIITCGFFGTSFTVYYMSSVYGATTQATALCFSNNQSNGGLFISYNSQVRLQYAVFSGTTAYGASVQMGSELQIPYCTMSNCGSGVAVGSRAEFVSNAGSLTITACTYGVNVNYFSSALINSAAITNCTTGIVCQNVSLVYAASATINTATTGISCYQGSFVYAVGVTFTSCTTNATPAVNTNGNYNAYIRN